MEKDWEARFKASERKSLPESERKSLPEWVWGLIFLLIPIPFAPLWLKITSSIVILVLAVFVARLRK